MNGRIKMYNEEKGFGFILGEDMRDFFFHISDVKSVEIPQRGQHVVFQATTGSKGMVAKEVFLKDVPTKESENKSFININGTQIRIADISQFGISAEGKYFVKVYEHSQSAPTTFTGAFFKAITDKMEWHGLWEEITEHDYTTILNQFKRDGYTKYRRYVKAYDGKIRETNNEVHIKESDLKAEKQRYLYITVESASRVSNFKFYENEVNFDLKKKLKEIEMLVNR